MYEVKIIDLDDGIDGNLTYLGDGLILPIDNETLDKTMMCMNVEYPYIAHSYTFRLDELNGTITGPQQLDKLNDFATQLSSLSEYERIKLEGAAMLTKCSTINDCTKLLYNLDSFELTPNVGSFEQLGKHFAENDFIDSLSKCPAEMMEYFDYALLGELGWDDSTHTFIQGHHIRDTEQTLREPNLDRDPSPAYMKMRLCSEENPDGVWLKFPLSGSDSQGYPVESAELLVALSSLEAESLNDCTVAECVSQYECLQFCLEEHADNTLEELFWKTHNLGCAESELGQGGSENSCKKFAAALEYEFCTNLDLATDISQNLRCYDFAPSVEAYAEQYLQKQGVDGMLTQCFDLEKLGKELIAKQGAFIASNGVICGNDQKFIHEYYQPEQEIASQAHIIKLYCPLEIKVEPSSTLGQEYGDIASEFELATIPSSVAQEYTNEINAAIEKDLQRLDGGGLAQYLDHGLADVIMDLTIKVEPYDGELYGVFEISPKRALTSGENLLLVEQVVGMAADGIGESFEQRPIKTPDGDLYISFWQSDDNYFLTPEQEFKQDNEEPTLEINL